jgi:SAM-dependent methyltransferase
MPDPAGVGPELFDDHYLHFYGDMLAARAAQDAELVARLLGLSGGEDVLDAPCGHGRISNLLAARGCRVVGVDNSARFLALAEADARRRGVEAATEYRLGDLRELAFEAGFDAALNWFTSFGYFDDAGNHRMLEGFARALRPGGRLVVELLNRDVVVRRIPPGDDAALVLLERGDDLLVDRTRLDAATGRTETERIVVLGGRVRRLTMSVRAPTLPELRDMLLAAGFASVEAFDERGEPFTSAARRLVVVARR